MTVRIVDAGRWRYHQRLVSNGSATLAHGHWYAEHAADTNDVRFRNAWSGRYLTVVDQGDYSVILAKTLNTAWPGQRSTIVNWRFIPVTQASASSRQPAGAITS